MLKRFFAHLLHAYWHGHRTFTADARRQIAEAIAQAERGHHGEICFVVEASLTPLQVLRGVSARERALEVFAQQHVWDTEHNSGVLVYLLLAEHAVEILADRGLHPAGADFWPQAVERLQQAFGGGSTVAGCVAAIHQIGDFLRLHFPAQGDNPDELPDPVRVL